MSVMQIGVNRAVTYPALQPPVKAPCNLRLPFSSLTSCFHKGRYDPSSRSPSSGKGVPKMAYGAWRSASNVARDRL